MDDLISKQIQVEEYNELVRNITSVHLVTPNTVDWTELANRKDICEDEIGPNEQKVLDELNSYKPTLRDKLFNRVDARKQIIKDKITDAKHLDSQHFKELADLKKLALRVLDNDFEAMVQGFNIYHTFDYDNFFGNTIDFVKGENEEMIVNITIENSDIVPNKVISLTKTNKLSRRKMAKGKYLELYRNYVLSTVFAVSRQVFAILPVGSICVNVYDESQADPIQGKGCILSVRFSMIEFEAINFEDVDCSEEIIRFEHNITHLKTKGFRFVEELE